MTTRMQKRSIAKSYKKVQVLDSIYINIEKTKKFVKSY